MRLEAGKLRKSLDSYYLNDGGADRVRISVPKGGYIPSFTYSEPSTEHGRNLKAGAILDQSRLAGSSAFGFCRNGKPAKPLPMGYSNS